MGAGPTGAGLIRGNRPCLDAAASRHDLAILKVSILDDHHSVRSMFSALLRTLGVQAITAYSDPVKAIVALQTFPPGLLFLDRDMRPPDGMDVLNWIRKSGECADPGLPVVMLTGFGDIARVKQARDAGANVYLVKPASAWSFYTRIAGVIEDQRSFVRTGAYFSPDGRWRELALNDDQEERRASLVPSP